MDPVSLLFHLTFQPSDSQLEGAEHAHFDGHWFAALPGRPLHCLSTQGPSFIHVCDDGVDSGPVGLGGVDVGSGTVVDSLQDERCTTDEFHVPIGTTAVQAAAEFLEKGVSEAHAAARLCPQMKTFEPDSSSRVSDVVSCFMASRTGRRWLAEPECYVGSDVCRGGGPARVLQLRALPE